MPFGADTQSVRRKIMDEHQECKYGKLSETDIYILKGSSVLFIFQETTNKKSI